MCPKNSSEPEDDMREYNFSGGVRGKFYEDPIPQIRIESRHTTSEDRGTQSETEKEKQGSGRTKSK